MSQMRTTGTAMESAIRARPSELALLLADSDRVRDVAEQVAPAHLRHRHRRGARVGASSRPRSASPRSIFPLTAVVQRVAVDFATLLGTDPDDVAPAVWKTTEL